MKKQLLRAVSGIMLSALLTVTVAIPVGASCDSHNIVNGTVHKTYPNASENNHQVIEVTEGLCTLCNKQVTVTHTYYEAHVPNANGNCYQCGYQVWHRP